MKSRGFGKIGIRESVNEKADTTTVGDSPITTIRDSPSRVRVITVSCRIATYVPITPSSLRMHQGTFISAKETGKS